MAKVKFNVEKGIKIPQRIYACLKYPFHEMNVGDSFVAPITSHAVETAHRYGRRRKKKFVTRKISSSRVRIWRTA